MLIFLKLFPKIAEEGTLPNSFLQGHHHPDTKTRQRQHKKRKLQANITDEHSAKILNTMLANRIQQHIKKLILHDQVVKLGLFQGYKDSSIHTNQSI